MIIISDLQTYHDKLPQQGYRSQHSASHGYGGIEIQTHFGTKVEYSRYDWKHSTFPEKQTDRRTYQKIFFTGWGHDKELHQNIIFQMYSDSHFKVYDDICEPYIQRVALASIHSGCSLEGCTFTVVVFHYKMYHDISSLWKWPAPFCRRQFRRENKKISAILKN